MAADIKPFIQAAQKTQEETGIPASIVLGQIILESSGKYEGGLSGLAAGAKNLFGIKGKGSAGSYYVPTKEWDGSKYITVQAGFRKYNSYDESIRDHAVLLTKERYAKQFANAKSVQDYAEGLQKAGYATSPTYASKLMNVIDTYKLNQYDNGSIVYKTDAQLSSIGSSTGSTVADSDSSVNRGFAGNLMFSVNRIILILIVVIVGIIFFMKAFPATSQTLDTATSAVKTAVSPTAKLKKLSGGKKKK